MEKKLSQYDDSFHALEAKSVRDRTRMEEMGKAKAKAEEEREIYRSMLETAHERGLRERQELRKDAQNKLEQSSGRNRDKKERIRELEKALKEHGQVEEEKNAYKEQCMALMEQCSELMHKLQSATGEDVQLVAMQVPMAPPAAAGGGGGGSEQHSGGKSGSVWERMKSSVSKGIDRAKNAADVA